MVILHYEIIFTLIVLITLTNQILLVPYLVKLAKPNSLFEYKGHTYSSITSMVKSILKEKFIDKIEDVCIYNAGRRVENTIVKIIVPTCRSILPFAYQHYGSTEVDAIYPKSYRDDVYNCGYRIFYDFESALDYALKTRSYITFNPRGASPIPPLRDFCILTTYVEFLLKQFGDLTVTAVEDVDEYLEKTYTPKVAVTTKIMELLRFCKQEHESIPIFHASCIAKVKSFEAPCSSRNVVEVCLQIAGCYSSDRLREKALAYLEKKLTNKATVVISEFTEKMEFHASLLTDESVNVVKSVYKKKRRKKKKAKSVNAISSNTDSVIVPVNSAEVDYVSKDLRYCTIRVASSFITFKIDTGADICFMSIHSFNSLNYKPKMSQTSIKAR
uniref:Peptidase A2 domain-containing protein n=1 Tax=Strongyloides papillosus TaxID=174720 RepID=A0A0N5BL22_STREA